MKNLRLAVFSVLALLAFHTQSVASAGDNPFTSKTQQAFSPSMRVADVSGNVDDCCCNVHETDAVNDRYVSKILDNLVRTRFFRTFKVGLEAECPFWAVQSTCGVNGGCEVCECDSDDVPVKWRLESSDKVDRSVADSNLKKWSDDARNTWLAPESGRPIYVDLGLNPEVNTGYVGPQATRVWQAIYGENCFPGWTGDQQCLEERVFSRLMSGFQSGITAHIFNNFYKQKDGSWTPNVQGFVKALGAFPDRVKNLYFSYLFMLRAVKRASPMLTSIDIDTGANNEDELTRKLLHQLLSLQNTDDCASAFDGFDEKQLFTNPKMPHLRDQFSSKFKNVSMILDCIACESCKMHAKLKITGFAAALRVLTGPSDQNLERNDIIAMVNTLQQMSEAIRIVRRLSAVAKGEEDPGPVALAHMPSQKITTDESSAAPSPPIVIEVSSFTAQAAIVSLLVLVILLAVRKSQDSQITSTHGNSRHQRKKTE